MWRVGEIEFIKLVASELSIVKEGEKATDRLCLASNLMKLCEEKEKERESVLREEELDLLNNGQKIDSNTPNFKNLQEVSELFEMEKEKLTDSNLKKITGIIYNLNILYLNPDSNKEWLREQIQGLLDVCLQGRNLPSCGDCVSLDSVMVKGCVNFEGLWKGFYFVGKDDYERNKELYSDGGKKPLNFVGGFDFSRYLIKILENDGLLSKMPLSKVLIKSVNDDYFNINWLNWYQKCIVFIEGYGVFGYCSGLPYVNFDIYRRKWR